MKIISTCILALLSFHLSAQCLLVEVPLNQRINKSSAIIEGKVIATRSFWNETNTMIYTSNTVEVLKVFKGNVTTSTVDIITQGGTVGLKKIMLNPGLVLKRGQLGMFMCEPVQRAKRLPENTRSVARYEVYAASQGFIEYNLNEGTASDPFKKYRSIPNELYRTVSPGMKFKEVKKLEPAGQPVTGRITAINNFTPTTIHAGTNAILTINGSGFGATQGVGFVEFADADNGGAGFMSPVQTEYLSWNDAQIVVKVPSGAGTGTFRVRQGATTFASATPLTVDYNHINVVYPWAIPPEVTAVDRAYETKHIDANGSGGYTFQYNTGFAANVPAVQAFTRALNTWRCATGINWTVSGTTTAENDLSMDGVNAVSFDNANPLAGALGVCASQYGACIVGGDLVWVVDEIDVLFDEGTGLPGGTTWNFGPAAPAFLQFDFESVAVHELGHGHQLGHVIAPGTIMHFQLANSVTTRALGANDQAAGDYVQGKSEAPTVCGPPMTAYTGCSALPINIGSITASQQGHGVQVEWTNESESDVDHYEVEESANGSAFTLAANVSPKNNNNSRAEYEWLDAQVANGNNYYRVKAVAHNGDVKYSAVVTVNFAASNKAFTVYPNPVTAKTFTAAFNNLPKGSYTLSIYNSVGQNVMSKTVNHGGGNAAQTVTLAGIPAGVYSVRLFGNGHVEKPVIITVK